MTYYTRRGEDSKTPGDVLKIMRKCHEAGTEVTLSPQQNAMMLRYCSDAALAFMTSIAERENASAPRPCAPLGTDEARTSLRRAEDEGHHGS